MPSVGDIFDFSRVDVAAQDVVITTTVVNADGEELRSVSVLVGGGLKALYDFNGCTAEEAIEWAKTG